MPGRCNYNLGTEFHFAERVVRLIVCLWSFVALVFTRFRNRTPKRLFFFTFIFLTRASAIAKRPATAAGSASRIADALPVVCVVTHTHN